MSIYNFISFLGILVIIFLSWCFSENKKVINYKLIFWCISIQLLFIFIIFVFPAGAKIFLFLNDIVIKILDASQAGTQFVFGRLALSPGTVNSYGESSLGFILAFQAFPTIIFFSSLMSILYFLKILPLIIRKFSVLFSKLMNISGAESLSATSNIFVGVESLLTITPYLKNMTRSELCTVLSAGMATVASNVLGIYVFCLRPYFPNIAAHLISASFISIPAVILISKLIVPETETPETLNKAVTEVESTDKTLFEAIINGAAAGVKLIVGITSLLIAIMGLVSLGNIILVSIGGKLNHILNLNLNWSFQGILGYIAYPFTLIAGIPLNDAPIISKIIGERLIITEVGSYQHLAEALAKGLLHSNRTAVITSYILCGFAHIPSMAIFIGGACALVPEKAKVFSTLGLKILLVSQLATLMTGCVAGVFYTKNAVLF